MLLEDRFSQIRPIYNLVIIYRVLVKAKKKNRCVYGLPTDPVL